MESLTREQIEELNGSILCWLATASETGQPNVSPKEMFICMDSNTIIVANIASPESIKNIQANPLVCFSSIDIFRQKGYKIKGKAIIHDNLKSPAFEDFRNLFHTVYGNKFPIQSIIEIKIASIQKIMAPSYIFQVSKTEEEMIKEAKISYNVK